MLHRIFFEILLTFLTLGTFVFSARIPTHKTALSDKRHAVHSTGNLTTPANFGSRTKRVDNARLTYYKAGQGACGGTNSDSDWIVALNSQQFENGAHCYKTITIAYNGKTAQAQIVDECPGCPFGGLDLTSSLFSYFASTDQGVIYGHWDQS